MQAEKLSAGAAVVSSARTSEFFVISYSEPIATRHPVNVFV